MLDFSDSDSDNKCQYTCEFWIFNFRYEIFYDLKKRCYIHNILDELGGAENMEVENVQDLVISELPTEMISRVFSFLTAIDLLVVRDVCQKWRAIVTEDRSLWNYAHFSSSDIDVKTTVSLLKEMPLLRSVELCNVHSPDDMTRLITALCNECWDLRQIHFPDACDWHPSSKDLHQLSYFHPFITSLHIATKQKLTGVDISNIGCVLMDFNHLKDLKLVGFYWLQSELIPEIIAKVNHLKSLSLPSLPGLNVFEMKQLVFYQPDLLQLTINTSSLSTGLNKAAGLFTSMTSLKSLRIIDNSNLTSDKLSSFDTINKISHMEINLNNSNKEEIINFFKKVRINLINLKASNCEYSDELLGYLGSSCGNITTLVWMNPKDAIGEVTDAGILAITKLPRLHTLEIKSRSVSKAYYSNLASLKNLKYARINGMRVQGCL